MIEEGARVRLRPGSNIEGKHAGLVDAVGVVGAIIQGRRWQRLDASDDDRKHDQTAHVRFTSPPVVLMSVSVDDLVAVDHLSPVLPD